MLVRIPQLLSVEQITALRQRLEDAGGDWVDGRATAGTQGVKVKRNQQIAENSQTARELGDMVLTALERNPLFISATLPNRVYPPMFNRYEGGMHFGAHVDNAVRLLPGTGIKFRTDVSATLFLSEPEEYEGGELVMEDTYGAHSAKLSAGDVVVYPSSSLHHVTPVTRGVRLACVFWVQSLVSDDADRSLLFDLDNSIQRLTSDSPNHPSLVRLTNVYHNLLRRWIQV